MHLEGDLHDYSFDKMYDMLPLLSYINFELYMHASH